MQSLYYRQCGVARPRVFDQRRERRGRGAARLRLRDVRERAARARAAGRLAPRRERLVLPRRLAQDEE